MEKLRVLRMTKAELEDLPEYSCSLPTGTTIGKRWRRKKDYMRMAAGYWIGEYVDIGSKNEVGIRWYEVELTDLPRPAPAVVRPSWSPECD